MKVLGVVGRTVEEPLSLRLASRAVLLDDRGQVALLYVLRDQYHTLPGGKVRPEESIVQALHREVLEETGCGMEQKADLGAILEEREGEKILRISYGFLGRAVSYGHEQFTAKEKEEQCQVRWVPLSDAVAYFEQDEPITAAGCYVVQRDKMFLQRALDQRTELRTLFQKLLY